jgi:hypothetical protein
MLNQRQFFFLTLVLVLNLATAHNAFGSKPATQVNLPPKDDSKNESLSTDQRFKLDSVEVSEPAPARPGAALTQDIFYRFRRALTVRVGPNIDSDYNDGKADLAAGADFLFPAGLLANYEAGADWMSEGRGQVYLSRRYIFARSSFRPYATLGIGVRIVTAEQMVTFIRLTNYHLRGGVGFESLIDNNLSYRLDIHMGLGIESANGTMSLGLVWGW